MGEWVLFLINSSTHIPIHQKVDIGVVLDNNNGMRFKVIIDDEKMKEEYAIGWGISVYFPDPRLLFDTGENYLLLEENLRIAGIEKEDIRHIFLPLEGWEHTGGLEAAIGVNTTVYVPSGVSDDLIEMIHSVGSECKIVKGVKEILPSFYATGNISPDIPEQVLLVRGREGVSAFVGSSDLGIPNIFGKAQSLGGPIDLLLGKFNTLSLNEKELLDLAKKIGRYKPKRVAPTHCSGELAREVFKRYFKKRFINVGIGLEGEV